jgi:hypothetical protein
MIFKKNKEILKDLCIFYLSIKSWVIKSLVTVKASIFAQFSITNYKYVLVVYNHMHDGAYNMFETKCFFFEFFWKYRTCFFFKKMENSTLISIYRNESTVIEEFLNSLKKYFKKSIKSFQKSTNEHCKLIFKILNTFL